MHYRIALVTLLSLCSASFCAAQTKSEYGIIFTDFDKVLSKPSGFGQFGKAMQAMGFTDTIHGLWILARSSQARQDFYNAWKTDLRDRDEKPIIGSEAYVNFLFNNHMPFVTEDKKKQLANAELYFKPNVELIKFYQSLHIPIYVLTDNDEYGYKRKLNALNEGLVKLGEAPFEPNGFYCAKPGTKEPGYSKNDPEYFNRAYNKIYAEQKNILDTYKALFVDDKQKNIASATIAAKKYNLNLGSFLYTSTPKDLDALRNKFGILNQ